MEEPSLNGPPPPVRPLRHRLKRAAQITAALFAAWLLLGFLAAPPLVRLLLERNLTRALSTPSQPRSASVGRVRVNPLALSCSIENLSVTEAGRGPLAGWSLLHASLDPRSFVSRGWRLRQLSIKGFSGHAAVSADGRLNVADLLSLDGSIPLPDADTPLLLVNELSITGASLDYSDASLPSPFSTRLGPIDIFARDFRVGGPGNTPGGFSAVTEADETVSWRGSVTLFPFSSRGEFRVGNLDVRKYAPFYGHLVRFDVLGGRLGLSIRYEIGGGGLSLGGGGLSLGNISLAERGQTAPSVTAENISLSGVTGMFGSTGGRRALRVGNVLLENGSAALRRDASGISLARLFSPAETTPKNAPAPTAPDANLPGFSMDVFEARNITVEIEDTVPAAPLRARATLASLTAANFSTETPSAPVPFQLAAALPDGGTLRASGSVAPLPFALNASVSIASAPLALSSPHAGQRLAIRVEKGSLDANATLSASSDGSFAISGDADISNLSVLSTDGAALQSWRNLALRGFSLETAPSPRLTIREITLDDSVTKLAILPDGSFNLAAILIPANTSANTTASAVALPACSIGNITLANARLDFADRSISPAASASLAKLNGSISNLSSDPAAHASLNLTARVDGAAPVSLAGRFNPLAPDANSTVSLRVNAAPLAPSAPYFGKYAGRSLASGTLNASLDIAVANRRLESSNLITLDKFALGPSTNSPDATRLPVSLAVALLRDRNGRIVLNIPVRGSLDDPDFRYGRAVWRAIGNLLVKTATAPFSLLAAIAGAGSRPDDDFSAVAFAPGSAALSEDALRKLSLIARALRERPSLRLSIAGGFDSPADTAALQNVLLSRQLAAAATPDNPPPWIENQPADNPADPAATTRLETLYREKFPAPGQSAAAPEPVARHAAAKRPVGAALPSPQKTRPASETPAAPLPSPSEMRARLAKNIPVDAALLRQLAETRAAAVHACLAEAEIPPDRLTLSDPLATAPRVTLTLSQSEN